MPEIVMVDEIGTEAEALACRTIAERGVQLVATAHGQLLENLIKNPTLSDLVGGIQSVTLGQNTSLNEVHHHQPVLALHCTALRRLLPLLTCAIKRVTCVCCRSVFLLSAKGVLVFISGDEEARNRGTQKSVLERKAPPTFPLVIEMRERAMWVTHWVEDSVDCLLHNKAPVVQVTHVSDAVQVHKV